MEQRKRCGMSCGGMDDEIILRLLRENEPVANRSESGSCGCGRRESEREGRESRENGRCGCSARGAVENERRESGSCGCGRRDSEQERRESRRSGRCGCGAQEVYDVGSASELPENGERCGRCAAYDRLTGLPLAMAYLPNQEWEELYGEEEALERGTMFKKLDLPFYPTPCNSRCERRGE